MSKIENKILEATERFSMEYLAHFQEIIIYTVFGFIFLWVIKKLSDWYVKDYYNADYEIEEKSNSAISLRRAGLYFGFAIGFSGSLGSEGMSELFNDLILQGIDLVLITVFMFIAFIVGDKLLLSKIDNSQTLLEGNNAVGAVEGAYFIATGLIAAAAFSGSGSAESSVIFFVLGQVVLLLSTLVYEKMSTYDIHYEISRANTSAGVMLGGILVSISLILHAALMGPSSSLLADITNFAIYAFMGIVLVILFLNKLVDKFFFPHTNLAKEIQEDENLAAIIITVAIKISLAYVIASLL